MKKLGPFYERVLNPIHPGPAFGTEKLDKLKERALCFLYYCKNVKNIVDLSLAWFNNTNLYTVYLEYLKEQRKLKPSSFKPYNCCYLPNLRMPLFQDLPCINVNARIKYCGDASSVLMDVIHINL